MKMETSDEVMDALKKRYSNYGFVLLQNAYKDLDEYRQKIKDFEKASGVEISGWVYPPNKVGNVVRAVLEGKHDYELDNLKSLKRRADHISEEIGRILKGEK